MTLILEESRGDGSETLPSGSWPRSWHLRDWTPPGKDAGGFNGWMGTELTKQSAFMPFCFLTNSEDLDNASSTVAISATAFLVVVVVVVEVSSRLSVGYKGGVSGGRGEEGGRQGRGRSPVLPRRSHGQAP